MQHIRIKCPQTPTLRFSLQGSAARNTLFVRNNIICTKWKKNVISQTRFTHNTSNNKENYNNESYSKTKITNDIRRPQTMPVATTMLENKSLGIKRPSLMILGLILGLYTSYSLSQALKQFMQGEIDDKTEKKLERMSRILNSLNRFGSCMCTASVVALDYKYNMTVLDWNNASQEERSETMNKLHERNAKRMLDLFLSLGGLFIKTGQYMSSLAHLLPDQYVQTMIPCRNLVPHHDWSQLEQLFVDEFGLSPYDLFERFDVTPIAAASLAQVHTAVTKSGEKVAVKIQYPELERQLHGDIKAIDTILSFVMWMFPDFKLSWLVKEFEDVVPKELDFLLEGKNSELCRENFKDREELYIPKVHWDLSTKRILTMEFVEGIPLDYNSLKNSGMDPSKVALLLNNLFFEQIFVHGFLHADPHAGNFLVRKGHNNSIQIALLDHGLYRTLDKDFRFNYANLWKAIIDGNEARIRKYGDTLGAGELAPLLACMMASRSWDSIIGRDLSNVNKSEIQGYVIQYAKEVTQVLQVLPHQILLVFKTIDLLKGLNTDLHADIDIFLILSKYCLKALQQQQEQTHQQSGWQYFKDMLMLSIKLKIYQLLKWLASFSGQKTLDAVPAQ